MLTRLSPTLIAAFSLTLSLAALSSCDSNTPTRCVPGRQVKCGCEGFREGIQRCSENRTYGYCSCDPRYSSPSENSDGDGDDYSGGGDGDDYWGIGDGDGDAVTGADGSVPLSGMELARGSSKLIDVYAAGTNVWVVDRDGVSRLSLTDGSELARWNAPRPLATSAFDGTHVVAADGAKFSVLSADTLMAPVEGTLVEACAAGVILGDGRFVCGLANDWDRIFYTYDIVSGALLSSSAKYTYNGIPMRAVPGRDAFVTVSSGSPSDFHVYEMQADTGEIVLRGESPYHGDFAATSVYTFDSGENAKSLVSSEGLLLRVDTCDGTQVTVCLEKNGALGTLTDTQRFVGLDVVGGTIYGLVSTNTSYFPYPPTADDGYLLQVVDVPTREVTHQEVVELASGFLAAVRGLPEQKAVVVGHRLGGGTFPYDSSDDGYVVLRLDLPE